MRSVLVSGAGIAGSTAAYWLARQGFVVTVVERGPGLRSSGSPVDVRGAAVHIADRMGVLSALRDLDTGVHGLVFVNADGRAVSRVDMRALRADTGEVELSRADLASVLHDAAAYDAEFLFGDSIIGLAQDGERVRASFEHAADRSFDLVVGADGVHSQVRALAFGTESDFVRHLGMYVATLPLPDLVGPDLVLYNAPGKAVAIHPAGGRPGAAFMFRAPAVAHFDHRDVDQHKQLLYTAYSGLGWRVPELLERVRVADDLYFDAVSRVHVDDWSRGRVTLVGDAAGCVSLFGDGSSSAMMGGYTLAQSLAGDLAAGLRVYESRHRPRTDSKERGATTGARLLVPATTAGIQVRNLAARFWPAIAVAQRIGRAVKPEKSCEPAELAN
jgi:2-polyprenyl-6-methoxyphenol hydroxylase-like FAD-dependent oxidoreductase